MNTVMRQAFINASVTLFPKKGQEATSAAIINTCAKALNGKAGIVNIGKGWNARLSFKTAERLGMPECLHPHARMAYDDMVKG